MTSSKFMRVAASLMLFALPLVASAHHSANEFDQTTVVEVEGKIVDVFWRNPHVIIRIAAVEDGEEVVWALEGASVSNQRRRGMNKDMLTSGALVRAAGYASTRQLNHMLLSNLLLPDGAELLLRRASAPRWANSSFGRTELAMDAAKVSAAEATAEGIFRVWTWGRATRGWWFFGGPDNFPLTEKGLATLDGYNEYEDNPVLKCVPPGMAATMGNPYPIEFVQVGDNIEYHSEEFDRVRTIHLNADPDANVDPSPLGYSVGRWEDENTLVIKTTKINAPYFNRVGVRQSEDVVVDERFTFDAAAKRLHYELSIVDPQTLTEPYEYGGHWNWAPGEEVGRYECAVAE